MLAPDQSRHVVLFESSEMRPPTAMLTLARVQGTKTSGSSSASSQLRLFAASRRIANLELHRGWHEWQDSWDEAGAAKRRAARKMAEEERRYAEEQEDLDLAAKICVGAAACVGAAGCYLGVTLIV